MVPRHLFPLIRSFSGHTVRSYFCFIACSLSAHPHLQGDIRPITFFPSGYEWFITGSEDGTVRIWDIRTGVWQLVIQGHRKPVRGVDISRTENLLATASLDRQAVLYVSGHKGSTA